VTTAKAPRKRAVSQPDSGTGAARTTSLNRAERSRTIGCAKTQAQAKNRKKAPPEAISYNALHYCEKRF